jgi:hypothetical protein
MCDLHHFTPPQGIKYIDVKHMNDYHIVVVVVVVVVVVQIVILRKTTQTQQSQTSKSLKH